MTHHTHKALEAGEAMQSLENQKAVSHPSHNLLEAPVALAFPTLPPTPAAAGFQTQPQHKDTQ